MPSTLCVIIIGRRWTKGQIYSSGKEDILFGWLSSCDCPFRLKLLSRLSHFHFFLLKSSTCLVSTEQRLFERPAEFQVYIETETYPHQSVRKNGTIKLRATAMKCLLGLFCCTKVDNLLPCSRDLPLVDLGHGCPWAKIHDPLHKISQYISSKPMYTVRY